MSFRSIRYSWLVFALVLAMVNHLDGRPRPIWTYKSLWSESETVCIGVVKSTKVVPNKEFLPDYVEGLESEVRIVAVLKGDTKSESIRFRHFRYRQDIRNTLGNGPTFAVLRGQREIDASGGQGGPVEIGANKTSDVSFLFFLKRRGDGTFGPTSGDDDASLSVAQVIGSTDDEVFRARK